MLAYVFWHRPRGSADTDEYERRLRAFHERLRDEPPAGFRESEAFRVPGLPWLDGRDGYEDWYVIDDWQSLGVLNDAAVDAAHRPDHDAVAAGTGAGAGGLYRHIAGDLALADAGSAEWSAARPEIGTAEALWQRQLVLGPAPEFCLLRRGSQRVSVLPTAASI